MIRMMADENIAEWAHIFGVEAATIQCVLEAAETGEIELPPVPKNTERRKVRDLPAGGEVQYTSQTIADYLGENWSEQRVQRCLQVLEKMGDEAYQTFSATSPTMATEIVATAEALVQANHKDEEAPSGEEEIKEEIVEKAQELTNAVAQGELSRRDLRGMRGKLPTDKPHPLGKINRDAEVELPVKDLDNDTMIRMMADENIAEWAHVFGVEAATIRCVLVAAEAGEISLQTADHSKGGRPAESFIAGDKTYAAQYVKGEDE